MLLTETSLVIWSILSGINFLVLFLAILLFFLSESTHNRTRAQFDNFLFDSCQKHVDIYNLNVTMKNEKQESKK